MDIGIVQDSIWTASVFKAFPISSEARSFTKIRCSFAFNCSHIEEKDEP